MVKCNHFSEQRARSVADMWLTWWVVPSARSEPRKLTDLLHLTASGSMYDTLAFSQPGVPTFDLQLFGLTLPFLPADTELWPRFPLGYLGNDIPSVIWCCHLFLFIWEHFCLRVAKTHEDCTNPCNWQGFRGTH